MLHIYELLSVVGTELFAKLMACKNIKELYIIEVIERIEEYNKLREYCNKQFKMISLTYNQMVPFVSKMWVISSKKYTLTGKRVKKEHTETASIESNIE
jgi:hypothetical protein